jgi:hypothetical protein
MTRLRSWSAMEASGRDSGLSQSRQTCERRRTGSLLTQKGRNMHAPAAHCQAILNSRWISSPSLTTGSSGRQFGERLSEWRRLSQSEAQTHHSAPFPDTRGLVDGPQVFTLLQADAHHRQIARSLAGPSLLTNRGTKGEPKERKPPKTGAKRIKKAPAGQTPPKAAKVQHTGGGSPQPAPAARTGGSLGSRRLSIYGPSSSCSATPRIGHTGLIYPSSPSGAA